MSSVWHNWSDGPWAPAVALALAHFLWQGLLVGGIAIAMDRALKSASASSRYAAHLIALVSLPVCLVLTLFVVEVPSMRTQEASMRKQEASTRTLKAGTPTQESLDTDVPTNKLAPDEDLKVAEAETGSRLHFNGDTFFPETIASNQSNGVQPSRPRHNNLGQTTASFQPATIPPNGETWLAELAPVIVVVYALGVFAFLLRLTLAVWGGQRLRKASQPMDDIKLIDMVARQTRRIGLRFAPAVAFCERVTVPTVVGVVRPMILVPASLATGLTPDQYAAIISHELAHIRRFDLLVNLIQRLIESLLFFHPIVWYLSRRISAEREACCDDLVVSSGYKPIDYAEALLRMAELCLAANSRGSVAVAATGNDATQFESRVRRLMTMTRQTQPRLTRAGAILMGLLLLPLVTVPPVIVGVVQAQESQTTDAINDTLQVQMAVRTPGPPSDEAVNAGKWQVAVDWKVPIRSEGSSASVISEVDGAILRIEWQAVRRHNGGLQFDGFNWSIENPIDRRDGVSLGGIGGRQITPRSSWFGDEFQSLASMQLDTAGEQKSHRTLVFRARHLPNSGIPKRLNIVGLTESGKQPSRQKDSEDEAEFQRQLNELQKLRINRKPTVDEVDDVVERLLTSYPMRAGDIHAQAAHVLGQSGIKAFAEDVCRHASSSLTSVSDPVGRARLFMYLSNAREVQGRMDDANYWSLRGLLELQPMQLPQVAPELPGLGAYRELVAPDADPVDSQSKNELFQRLAASEQQVRETARQTQQLVQFRDIFIQILRRLNKTPEEQERLQEILNRRMGLRLPLRRLLQAGFETDDADALIDDLPQAVSAEQSNPSESRSRFQTAYESDSSFGRASIKHAGQRQTIENWKLALQQDDLTLQQQIFAWWRIGSLAAYNFRPSEGETSDNDLAAKAFQRALSIGSDLICRETLNAATVYATLGGGTREDQANRMEFAKQWLATRTDAMVLQSARMVNHNGYGIDGRLMPGGMNLQTVTEKQEFLTKQLADARDSLAARVALNEAQTQDEPNPHIARAAQHLVDAAGQPTWKLAHVDPQPSIQIDDASGYQILLRRSWKEYTSPPQQKETGPDGRGPFEVRHEDWEFVLFPLSLDQSQASWKSKLAWNDARSPYHTQAIFMGEGHGFVWYCKGTLFGQEAVREKLKLSGGDDRIDLLIAGMQIEDMGSITSNSCPQQIARFGDKAVGPIETAIETAQDPTALRRLIGSLAYIRSDAATELLMQLHQSDKEKINAAADYALVHRPLRRTAMPAYLNMLIKRRHVDIVCEGCVHFNWKEALPILHHLVVHPERLRELSWTIPARRELQGNPIADELFKARQTIIGGQTDPDDLKKAWQTLADSDDFEAVVLIGIELATYATKGPQRGVNETGIRLLLTQPRDEVTEYLQSVRKAMPMEHAERVKQLLQRIKQQEQLERLKSYGILVTPGGIGGASYRYVVPSDFRSGSMAIDALLQYCVSYSPKSEIVFFGPVIVEDQLQTFRLLLPHSHVRHMAAVWLNVVSTVPDDESQRNVFRISDIGSPAREIGLKVGDVIVGVGEFRWPESESRDSCRDAFRRQLPGQQSKLYVKRDGQVITLPLVWEESRAHHLLCDTAIPTLQRQTVQAVDPDSDEQSTTDDIQALTGNWKATQASHHLLDSKLVEANQTGFAIAIDNQFGESFRRTSDAYENQYKAFLEQQGHDAVASGTIKFDYGGESELMISRKGGSLYLWYGVVTGGNPRMSLDAGPEKNSDDILTIEWTSSCSDSPVDLTRGDARVVYERSRQPTARRSEFQQFSDQVVEVAVATLYADQPEYAEHDLAEKLKQRIRMIVDDARPMIEKRPVAWRESLVENLRNELHNVCVAKSFGAEYRERLAFYAGLKAVEWKLWQAVNRNPADETTPQLVRQRDWLRDHIVSLPEVPIPGTQYPSYKAILDQLAAEIANPMQPLFKTALPQEQFAEVQRQLAAETNHDRPIGKDRVFNDSLLVVLPYFVRYEIKYRWGIHAADSDKARLPFSKELPFVGHSMTNIIFQHLTDDYPFPEQIRPFKLAVNSP